MASDIERLVRSLRHRNDDWTDRLSDQIAQLRDEFSSLASRANRQTGKHLGHAQHELEAWANAAQEQLPIVAKAASRQAVKAGKALRNDPVPVLVMVGTAALLASLIFREGRR